MEVQKMDPDVAVSVAGVVRLLRRAGELVWAQADVEGPRSSWQLLGLGIDLAADEARDLLADSVGLDGPVPVGSDPAGLIVSAARLLRLLCMAGAPAGVHVLLVRVAELVGEANVGAGG